MEILLFILIFIGIMGYLFFQLNDKKTKAPAIKKDEIIEQYRQELRKILKTHEGNKNKQVQAKKAFLQKCNSELSRNIFFTELEANQIIQDLAHL